LTPPVRVITVDLLLEDSELGALLPAADRLAAVGRFAVPTLAVARGRWTHLSLDGHEAGAIGVLLLEGALGLEATHAGRSHMEVLGPGDVAQPWLRLQGDVTLSSDLTWRVLLPTRLAILDADFARACAEFPGVLTATLHRLVQRSRRLGVQNAIVALPRVSDRVHRMLWYLCERFGVMTADGARLELPLSHRELAELVAARRPTVTTALAQLAERDLVRREDRTWILLGDPPEDVVPASAAATVL
jgi:CRP/FNR family cyclic AMP-dependent transcriptional regulator